MILPLSHRPAPSHRDDRAVAFPASPPCRVPLGRSTPRLGRRAGQPPRRAAFSLIELLTVLVIIGVLSAVAIPRYANSLSHYKADAAARQVVADLHRAAAAARATSRSVTVTFDPDRNRYSVQNVTITLSRGGSDTRRFDSEITGGELVSAEFGGETSITFDGFGRPSTDGKIILRFGENLRQITVDPASGRASFTRSAEAIAAKSAMGDDDAKALESEEKK